MLAVVAALLVSQAAAASPPPTPPCTAPDFAAFDFWIGEWDVYPSGKDTLVAHSRIEKLYGGCAIRENWMPLKGTGGGSLSEFEPATGRWHQTWIGSAPGRVDFDGGLVDGKMVLTGWWPKSGPKGEDGLTRMSYSRVEGNAVRQFGEFSADHGLTWQTSFDFVYRPHKAATP
jgi:hypothetical protein|uniref:hypothetical protein n=1 Tax=Altererythrobacter segetis TaxID=1104773 RepID=UPI00140ADA0A|nr:hypothetical protein [Altererythrobacter segetis]